MLKHLGVAQTTHKPLLWRTHLKILQIKWSQDFERENILSVNVYNPLTTGNYKKTTFSSKSWEYHLNIVRIAFESEMLDILTDWSKSDKLKVLLYRHDRIYLTIMVAFNSEMLKVLLYRSDRINLTIMVTFNSEMLKVLTDRSDRTASLQLPFSHSTKPIIHYSKDHLTLSDIKSKQSDIMYYLVDNNQLKKTYIPNLDPWYWVGLSISMQYCGQLMDNPASGLDLRGTMFVCCNWSHTLTTNRLTITNVIPKSTFCISVKI